MTDTDEGIASDSESPTSLQGLVRQMHDKEQRLLALEAEAAKVMLILAYLVNRIDSWHMPPATNAVSFSGMVCLPFLSPTWLSSFVSWVCEEFQVWK